MNRKYFILAGNLWLMTLWLATGADASRELRVGIAGHAFDHLGAIGGQAEAAAASGANIIYVSGLGALGYQGLPSAEQMRKQREATVTYLRAAKRNGIRLAIGYVCATSMVNLKTFDQNWAANFRARFRAPPSEWRQQDEHGNPLPSWYSGDYQPACMNNPDWRAYEKFIVGQQLEAGCDGIFFDNPTVHPRGCFCRYCMERFGEFLEAPGASDVNGGMAHSNARMGIQKEMATLREFATNHPADFMRFRCTMGKDFLKEMRTYARNVKRGALITANNSLNSADALYSQCRTYAYNVYELSQAEDFVVVEDMSSQPRMLSSGQAVEYGPTYKQLHAISHQKPIVAVTVAEADYHTPPNLVRLAMAEAAANDASYLSWPTWPEQERARMISLIRPEADFLRRNAALLNETRARSDVTVFLPFRKWLETGDCKVSRMAAELSRANAQYAVICEDDLQEPMGGGVPSGKFSMEPPEILPKALGEERVLLLGSRSDLTANDQKIIERFSRQGGAILAADKPEWLKQVQSRIGRPSVLVKGSHPVRAIVRDQRGRTIVHLLNLDVQRLSSFQDKVNPVLDLHLTLRVPFRKVRSVRALTADADGTSGALKFVASPEGRETVVETTLARLAIATILVLE